MKSKRTLLITATVLLLVFGQTGCRTTSEIGAETASASAGTLACQQKIIPFYGPTLGVRDKHGVHRYSVENNAWVRRGLDAYYHVPEDAEGLLFNSSKFGVARAGRIHFYESGEETGSIPFPKMNPGDVIVNNLFSTQMELLVVGPHRSVVFDSDGEHELARHDNVLPARMDCVFDAWNALAVVAEGQVRFYAYEWSEEHSAVSLKPMDVVTYTLPEETDEVIFFAGDAYLGIRRGSQLHFLQFDSEQKTWTAASSLPNFNLDERANLPLSRTVKPNTNVVERDARYYLYQDDKPLTSGFDGLWLNDRLPGFAVVAQNGLRGLLDAWNGKIVLPIEYAALSNFSYGSNYDELRGLAERNGKLFVVTLDKDQLVKESPAPKYLPSRILPQELRQSPTKPEGRLNGVYVPASYPDLLLAWDGWKQGELLEPNQPAIVVQGDIAHVSFGLFRNQILPFMPNMMRACQTGSGLELREYYKDVDNCVSKEPPLIRFEVNKDRSLHCIECWKHKKWIPLPPVAYSFVGIGIAMEKEPNETAATIHKVIPKGPAAQAKLLPGDLVTKVDGESVETLSIEQIVDRIRGEAGTSVTLAVVRGSRQFSVTIVRRALNVQVDASGL